MTTCFIDPLHSASLIGSSYFTRIYKFITRRLMRRDLVLEVQLIIKAMNAHNAGPTAFLPLSIYCLRRM